MKKLLLVLLLPLSVFAQKDTTFWFAAPDINQFLPGNPHDRPILIRLITFSAPSTITISIPANPLFTPINISIPANSSGEADLSAWADEIENAAANTVANKGILIKATADITAYYEIVSNCNCNPELFSLKGRNSLGNEFIIPSQTEWAIDSVRFPQAKAAFDIIATEDNTVINITPSKHLIGRLPGIPFSVSLNKGQTFSNQGLYRSGISLLNGSIVTSTKPIAVTTYEDLLMADGPCADLAGDQLIPTSIWGSEFVVVKGDLTNKDKVVVTAMTNGTNIYLNGNTTPSATINRGNSYELNLSSQPVGYITSNNKISVYHYTGINCEIGSAVIPKINCTGSNDIAITRSISEDAVVFITTRAGNQGGFMVNGINTIIAASDFSPVPGSGGNFIFCKKNLNTVMPTGSPTRFINTIGKFQLGFLNGASPASYSGCRYGFFSDFKSSSVERSQVEICRTDSTQLNAFGGISYQWSPAAGLSSVNIANPKASPFATTDYRIIITTAEGCIDSAFVRVIVNTNCIPVVAPCRIDFSYRQDVCNPNAFQFTGIGDNPTGTYWNFGDGNTVTANANPTHTYSSAGNYVVRYGFQNGSCTDTVTKTISVNVVPDNIILTQDTTICFATQKQLRSVSSLNFCWSPTTYLNDPLLANPVTSTPVPITYYLTAEVQGTNVITNGNFNAGNTGFTSDYAFAANNTTEGEYFVGNSPQAWNAALSNCGDHSTGNGNMLLVNGSPVANVKVWTQTVPVTPNTNYAFSSWIQALYPPNPAQLSFSINGSDIGTLITASLPTCTWSQFYTTWNSGSNTTANISIVNKNTIVLGNDFALDDISFAPVFIKRDSIKISIDTPRVITRLDTTICQNSSVQLNTVGAATYSWTPTNGLSNAATANPVASPTLATEYIVTGTTVNGCIAKDTVNVTINALPVISASSANIIDCLNPSSQLSAVGAGSYSWSPAGSLSNPTIANPIATPAITTQYTVTGTAPNGCSNTASVTVNASFAHQSDFSLVRNVCNPLDVTFQTDPANFTTVQWNFGDGNTSSGTSTPSHTYIAFGNYTVRMIQTYGACRDTVTKQITVAVQNDPTLIQTPDTTICYGLPKQLRSQPGLSYCWTPSTYLNNPASQNPVTNTPANITYYLTSEVTGINIINNGNFNAGNTGFTSQYNFTTNNFTEGEFNVGSNPTTWNVALSNCTDHTSSNGNMLLVNGSPVPNVRVWNQTVTVTPNTNYSFAAWIQALHPDNPAKLGFSINGQDIGTSITASLPTCTWSQFYTTWNSGNNTSALISIVNKNTIVQGNDFALDDISFAPVLIKRDSIKITIDSPSVKSIADTAVCKKTPVQLNSSGAVTYSWSPATGLSSATTGNPIATPADTTRYIVTGTNSNGCTAKDTVMVYVKPLPVITTSGNDTICDNQSVQLSAGGGIRYAWSPVATLNNATIANPIARPTAMTTYTVVVTGSNNCSDNDSVKISLRPLPNYTVSPGFATCVNGNAPLSASGGTSYLWSPAQYLNSPNISNPVATVSTNTVFTVVINDSICKLSNSLTTIVTTDILPPVITASKSSDIDCVFSSVQLKAIGANVYRWSPATDLSNNGIANPIATPAVTRQYTVVGTDSVNNCKSVDTITVFVKKTTAPKSYIPNTFTPNGDGTNDCFRVRDFGTVKTVDVMIFNRFGNLVFQTKNVNDCWDGSYKGQPAEVGNYVYYVKVLNDCGEEIKKGNLLLIR